MRPDHEKPKSFEQDHELGVEFEKEGVGRKLETVTTRLKLVAN